MEQTTPLYNSYQPSLALEHKVSDPVYGFKVVDCLADMMKVVAIRSAVFLNEQNCPFNEEFDDNDFCALHIIGYAGIEPAACIRIRFFVNFVKFERLAVRHQFRNTALSFNIIRAAIQLSEKKGYQKIYGHVQDRLVNFWNYFGAKAQPKRCNLVFSDFSYTEMLLETAPCNDAISLETDPYILIRSEGKWDEQGILEHSSLRKVSSPL